MKKQVSFGDRVRIIESQETLNSGFNGKNGECMGYTTPSITNVEYIGDQTDDFAFSVQLDDHEEQLWFTEDLIEFISHNEGTVMEVGNIRATRLEDGSWNEELIDPTLIRKPWYKFW